jgi:hypothetical protein
MLPILRTARGDQMSEHLITAFVNPLQLLELDEPWADRFSEQLTPEVFLNFLCTPSVRSDSASLAARYKEISIERVRLFAPPYEPTIMERLVWPLRHAKAAYIVGNCLATIALAGVVAEMTGLLLWDVFGTSELERSGKVRKELGSSTFENADQARRVRVLRTLGLISADEVHAYGRIRAARRMHMHLLSNVGMPPIEKTAVAMFDDAVFLVSAALGLGISSDGVLTMKQEILQYVKQQPLRE